MADIIVIGFDQEHQAKQAMTVVRQMAVDGLLDVEDMGVVTRDAAGQSSYQPEEWQPGAGTGAGLGGALGLFVGALLIPLTGGAGAMAAGGALGAGTGLIAGGLSRLGVDLRFTELAQELLQPGTAALVIQVGHVLADPDALLARLPPVRGKLLQTTLDPAAETKLRAALEGTA
jgi:uncharacterized membrane protein